MRRRNGEGCPMKEGNSGKRGDQPPRIEKSEKAPRKTSRQRKRSCVPHSGFSRRISLQLREKAKSESRIAPRERIEGEGTVRLPEGDWGGRRRGLKKGN